MPDGQFACLPEKKKGSGDCEFVSGWCRRGGPDQRRANSLNTGRVKSPLNSWPSQS